MNSGVEYRALVAAVNEGPERQISAFRDVAPTERLARREYIFGANRKLVDVRFHGASNVRGLRDVLPGAYSIRLVQQNEGRNVAHYDPKKKVASISLDDYPTPDEGNISLLHESGHGTDHLVLLSDHRPRRNFYITIQRLKLYDALHHSVPDDYRSRYLDELWGSLKVAHELYDPTLDQPLTRLLQSDMRYIQGLSPEQQYAYYFVQLGRYRKLRTKLRVSQEINAWALAIHVLNDLHDYGIILYRGTQEGLKGSISSSLATYEGSPDFLLTSKTRFVLN